MIYTVIIRQRNMADHLFYVADHLFHIESDLTVRTPEFSADVFHKAVAQLHISNMEYWTDAEQVELAKKLNPVDVIALSGNLPAECSLVAVFPGAIETVDGDVI